jgi:hypothetical protein
LKALPTFHDLYRELVSKSEPSKSDALSHERKFFRSEFGGTWSERICAMSNDTFQVVHPVSNARLPQKLGSFTHVRCDPRLVAGDAGNTANRGVEATALAFSTQ